MTKRIFAFRNFANAPNKENNNEDVNKTTEIGREYKDVQQQLEGIKQEENTVTVCCLHVCTVQSVNSDLPS
jgi:hypothetical protein